MITNENNLIFPLAEILVSVFLMSAAAAEDNTFVQKRGVKEQLAS
jgi:hypothetical protein